MRRLGIACGDVTIRALSHVHGRQVALAEVDAGGRRRTRMRPDGRHEHARRRTRAHAQRDVHGCRVGLPQGPLRRGGGSLLGDLRVDESDEHGRATTCSDCRRGSPATAGVRSRRCCVPSSSTARSVKARTNLARVQLEQQPRPPMRRSHIDRAVELAARVARGLARAMVTSCRSWATPTKPSRPTARRSCATRSDAWSMNNYGLLLIRGSAHTTRRSRPSPAPSS
jgi:hypothetical protein